MRIALAPLTLALLLALPQEPAAPAPPKSGFPGADFEAKRLRTEILGAWQLTRGEIPNLGTTGSGVAGYALIQDGYLSMEVHVRGKINDVGTQLFFQTGTHRWKLDDRSMLETFSLIGTFNSTFEPEYDFEEPGRRREYQVTLENDQLVLARTDRTARFTFKRLGKLRYPDAEPGPELDFYGRPIKAKGDKPTDGSGGW